MVRETREFTSELAQLAELRQWFGSQVRRTWPDAALELLTLVELAVQEAAANVVIHAYEREPGRPIYADLQVDDQQLALTLTHEGRDFDPAAVPPPAFDGSRTGGFGVHLIRELMDEVCYLHAATPSPYPLQLEGGEGRVRGRCGIRLVKRRTQPAVRKPKMQLLVEKFDDVTVVAVQEQALDAGNADEFRRAMAPVLADARKLVLDLDKVSFVDSRGCGAILSCLKSMTEASGDLKLCRVTRPARITFDLIRLHRVCEIVDTREQALAAFRKQ
jgi:anti-sigma B factor antagonist